ncbi:ABC transporter transmembrane domain-containing protein [Streptomyces cyaneofuscatus]|uniref:ABC transporter transmembrane domain-containing protein n=1 Tax=Streptomyces cyaneofuscatus TaxID=66883 RepID=UPI00340D5A30
MYLTAAELFAPGPEGVDQGRIGWIAAFTALAVILRSVLAGASSYLAHVTAYRILARLRLALADRLQRIPLGRVQRRSSGETKKLLHDDVEQLEEALAQGVPDLAAAAAVPLATTALLMAVDWRLGLVALVALVLLLAASATGVALANKNNAALAAQCDDVVRALPGGLDHHLADGGSGLSGGQRQRLSIAGALLKDSPVLILDEAVAAVDPQTEAKIQEALARMVAGRTTVVIAHRLDTVREVDRIVVLADGSVEAAATHEELLATSPTYRALLAAHSAEEIPSISSRHGLRAETTPAPEELR